MIHISGKPVLIHVSGKPVLIHVSGKPVLIHISGKHIMALPERNFSSIQEASYTRANYKSPLGDLGAMFQESLL